MLEFEDDEAIALLELLPGTSASLELDFAVALEEEDFAEDELYGSPPLCSEDDNDEEDSSTSGAELLLSSPQAARNAEPHKTAVATVNFPKNFILLS